MTPVNIERFWLSKSGRYAGALSGHGKSLLLELLRESQVRLARFNRKAVAS